jgi:hypothetical protein
MNAYKILIGERTAVPTVRTYSLYGQCWQEKHIRPDGIELRLSGLPACSLSLHWLSYDFNVPKKVKRMWFFRFKQFSINDWLAYISFISSLRKLANETFI